MYHIKSNIDKPDIAYLYNKICESMKLGVAVNNLDKLGNRFNRNVEMATSIIKENYGISNPNSSKQVLDYFKGVLLSEISVIAMDYTSFNIGNLIILNMATDIMDRGIKELSIDIVRGYNVLDGDNERALNGLTDCLFRVIHETSLVGLYRMGKWTTNADAMTDLAIAGRQDAIDILTFRKNKKFAETIQTLKNCVDERGFIHPSVSLGVTNRINYSDPALMNIPKELLWSIIGPRKHGNMLISVDIKNQEPWVMINMLGIERLKMLLDMHGGLYEKIYKDIFGKEPERIERNELKVVWNAMTYGMSKFGVKNTCKHIDGEEVYKYFNSFKEFKQYKSKCKSLASKGVTLAKTYFGTELHADASGSALARVLMDIGIQGTGSDILSLLVKHFDKMAELCHVTGRVQIYFTRHDECIIEVDKEVIEETSKEQVMGFIKAVFEHKIDDWEPFQVEIKELGLEEISIDYLDIA